MKNVKGKVAVVTGAASGIGLAMCERFAADGMRLLMADLKDSPLTVAAAKLRSNGAEVLAFEADVGVWEQVQALARAATEHFGGVHVVCNNAAVKSVGPIWKTSMEDWHWVINTNLFGVVHGIKAFAPDMIANGEPGHFVNTSSVGGLMTNGGGAAPYHASKYGIVAISEVLHHEMQEAGVPIGVSVLCPGSIPTNLRENSNRLRPSGVPVPSKSLDPTMMPATTVADMVMDGIRNDRFWILTHRNEYRPLIEKRCVGIVETDEVFRAKPL